MKYLSIFGIFNIVFSSFIIIAIDGKQEPKKLIPITTENDELKILFLVRIYS